MQLDNSYDHSCKGEPEGSIFRINETSSLYCCLRCPIEKGFWQCFRLARFVSLRHKQYAARIMLNQMLLLRRLNNYSSAQFSSPWNGLPSKQQNARLSTIKFEWLALLSRRVYYTKVRSLYIRRTKMKFRQLVRMSCAMYVYGKNDGA